MNAKDWFSELESQFKQDPEYHAEGIRLRFYESILEHMEQQNITRAELARRLGCKPSYVSRIFNDTANISVLSLARIAFAVDCEIIISVTHKSAAEQNHSMKSDTDKKPCIQINRRNPFEEAVDAGFDHALAA
jgi:transcriptional regulator with XRE-family HTH domain